MMQLILGFLHKPSISAAYVAESGRLKSSGLTWTTEWVQDQPKQLIKILSLFKKNMEKQEEVVGCNSVLVYLLILYEILGSILCSGVVGRKKIQEQFKQHDM